MTSFYEPTLRQSWLESPIVVVAAMIIGVAGLLGVTRWGLNTYFADRDVQWQQEIVDEKARVRALHAKQAEQGVQARAARISGGMRLLGDQVLEEIKTGLLWTASDNGVDLSWKGAIEHCKALELDGGGWTLPTPAQLLSLHDRQVTEPIACGDTTCKVSPLFTLSRQFAWSNESAGENLAWYVSLESGAQFAESTRVPSYYRALCVRAP